MQTVVFMENLEDKFKKSIMENVITGKINGKEKTYTRPEDWKK
jgi:hypothetical protein